jgi:hypothetical protein
MAEKANMENREACKQFFLRHMSKIREDIREQLAERAADNLIRYYSLLRSTGVPGMEDLIAAIHGSTFSISNSCHHHHYPSGTMEHCLGVYKRMSEAAVLLREKGNEIKESDVILVALLHDVCRGKRREWSDYPRHGLRSRLIVEKYLPEVSPDVLEAIEKHMHEPTNSNLLWSLVRDNDYPDGLTCNRGEAKLSDTEKCRL